MRNRDRARFTDPSIKDKIKAMENTKEVQNRLNFVKEEMKSRTLSILNYKQLLIVGMIILTLSIAGFIDNVLLSLIIICSAFFISKSFKEKQKLTITPTQIISYFQFWGKSSLKLKLPTQRA